jgi:aromatic-L-amino-acid decarboxylase
VHHSVAKAIAVAGIPRANLREIAVDAQLRLDVAALREQISRDRAEGHRPFLVIAAAGTTNTGAIDPLPALADLCRAEGLWLHVDGAYGGAFVLCPTGRDLLAGIERADSITFDPHKGMFLPYGTGCLLVRDGGALRHAHRGAGAYLRDLAADPDDPDDPDELPNPSAHGPELSRSYRGYRVWLSLQLHGLAAFREALEEKLALTRWLYLSLQAAIDRGAPLELAVAPQCTVVAFRVRRGTNEPLDRWNDRTMALLGAIRARGRVVPSSTLLPLAHDAAQAQDTRAIHQGSEPGVLTLRACILSFRTHGAIVKAALEDILLATEELAAEG